MSKRNHLLQIAYFLFLLIFCVAASQVEVVTSQGGDCLLSFCNKNKKLFPIHYPFKLENQKLNYSLYCDSDRVINLKCSDQLESIPILNLPNYGDFYVRNINYDPNQIHLYDPNNCLPARLMMINSNFPSSPSYNLLKAIRREKYTFLSCSRDIVNINIGFNMISNSIIDCLSNSTSYTLATSSMVRAQEMISSGYCYMNKTLQIPVSSRHQFENNGFDGDLVLSWEPILRCLQCNPVNMLIFVWLFGPIFVALPVIYACKYAKRRIRDARARRIVSSANYNE